MNRRTPWAGAAALAALVGLGTASFGADEPTPRARRSTFGNKPAPKPAVVPPIDAKPTPDPAAVAASQRDDEEANYLRRLAVIDRLRTIGRDTQNDELLRQADELDEKAAAVYRYRTSHLPSARAVGDSVQLIDRTLGPAGKPTLPAAAAPTDKATASAAKGVKP